MVTLDRGSELAFAFGGGFFVELAGAKFRQKAGFLYGALEAAERHFEGLVFLDADGRHETP